MYQKIENYFKLPEPLLLVWNISENWKIFSQKIDLVAKVTSLVCKEADENVAQINKDKH